MRKTVGIVCIVAGILCLLMSAGLVAYNRIEAASAADASHTMLQMAWENIEKHSPEQATHEIAAQPEEKTSAGQVPQELLTVDLDGYECIGILSLPVLELELPVLQEWSYEKLKKAPCQYYGSCYDSDFVIAAHNYPAHFGRLSELQPKDMVLFTDVAGTVHCYEVALLETLPPTATAEMITSGFDLSLYTCTPGGGSRVTVRCNKI